jgi:hyaluronoglucosaminidase
VSFGEALRALWQLFLRFVLWCSWKFDLKIASYFYSTENTLKAKAQKSFNTTDFKKFHSRGDKIAILYDPGDWPKIETHQDGHLIYKNGGLPQNGSIDLHLRQFEIDVDRFIPNKSFDGVAVIDFECWRPSFRQNFGDLKIYRDLTLLEVNKKHPFWNREAIEAQGKVIFETAASNFVNRTIMRARKLRPSAKWGFYGFPHCFNRYRDQWSTPLDVKFSNLERCPEQVEAENNKLMFMYPSAIYPSIYITQNQSNAALTKFVQGKMSETNRVGQLTGNANMTKLAFVRYQYTDSMVFMKNVS